MSARKDLVAWRELTREQLRRESEADAVVLVPVGAVEQHGTHLPLDTDIHLAERVVNAVAESEEHVLVAPSIAVGYSPHHRYLPGAITLSKETFLHVVEDVCLSIKQNGFRKTVLVNGHGGNHALLTVAVQDFVAQTGYSLVLVTYWNLIREEIERLQERGLAGMGHACETETSLELYLRPEHVVDTPVAGAAEWPPSEFVPKGGLRGGKVVVGYDEQRLTGGSGVLGRPDLASAGIGEELFAAVVRELKKVIADLNSGRLGI
jgi:creatinine amidohydrolase